MRLDWNDIKARAAKFAEDWNGAQYERGETQTFYNEFFQLFGVTRRRVASFEHGVNLPDKKRGYLELFWKGKLLVESKVRWTQPDARATAGARLFSGPEAGYRGHKLARFLVRLLFCLFADDTGIFQPHGIFEEFLKDRTREDDADLGPMLSKLFEVLDTPETERGKKLDGDLARFDYINGELFHERLPLCDFDRAMRDKLLYACGFNWEKISPPIFGSLFQSVMDKVARRKQGAHYTSEKNILKLIEPLFFDDLKSEFARLKARKDTGRRRALEDFHAKLGGLIFFDPACGCGNFLVIAYREIRRLETETLRRLAGAGRRWERTGGQQVIGLELLCKVTVDQFFGIEIDEWAARISRTALYLIDHIANTEISKEFGQHYVRFPIPASPHIRIDNAIRIDWNVVLPADRASYVFGNPPFIGMSLMNDQQDEDNKIVFEIPGLQAERSGRLDYVACWYAKAIDYARSRPIRFAFVSTNSITQGEQARSMGPFLRDHGFAIDFAHRQLR